TGERRAGGVAQDHAVALLGGADALDGPAVRRRGVVRIVLDRQHAVEAARPLVPVVGGGEARGDGARVVGAPELEQRPDAQLGARRAEPGVVAVEHRQRVGVAVHLEQDVVLLEEELAQPGRIVAEAAGGEGPRAGGGGEGGGGGGLPPVGGAPPPPPPRRRTRP